MAVCTLLDAMAHDLALAFSGSWQGHAADDHPGHLATSDLCSGLEKKSSFSCFGRKVRFMVGFFEAPFLPYLQDMRTACFMRQDDRSGWLVMEATIGTWRPYVVNV